MEGRARISAAIFTFTLCSILLPLPSAGQGLSGIDAGFYEFSCPQAEDIVAQVVSEAFKKEPGIAAGFLRLFFHDCFVNGCDASLLLDATPSGEKTEKYSRANGNLRGLEVLDDAKARLENECPGIVSCADTLAFATRDGSVLSGVPHFQVAGGRRDGLVSNEKDIAANIPLPNWSVQNITQLFVAKGMTQEEMVVLTGAHSVGRAHCPTFLNRVNKYNTTHEIDPKLDAEDAAKIKSTCQKPVPFPEIAKTSLPLDSSTTFKMDYGFYKQLLNGKGLIESDRAMAEVPGTRQIVMEMASNDRRWLRKFSQAIVRLSAVDVKTGTEGEIRKNCRFVNPGNAADSGNAVDSGTIGFPGNVINSVGRFIGRIIS